MSTKFFAATQRFSGLFGFLALGAIVAEGCHNDSNPAPTPPTVSGGTGGSGASGGKGGSAAKGGGGGTGNEAGTGADGGTTSGGGKGGTTAGGAKGGKGGSGAKGGSGGTGNNGESGNGNEGGTGEVTSSGGTSNSQGGAGAGNETNCDAVGQYQCYPCPPTTNLEYLNRCNDSKCSKFDNATRIQNFTGTLPPL
jgi:hypothetical protein